ncbi:MAG TPA: MurR/RpiR family transcriptional regulator [Candidatus Agrococcus pullicola]|uniref:MurR/RpiR family transcriptional regulator n=1 Tax=Candidatus Agrococcus pullicola TaxID=2838429 RepID=A0A9D1YY96_9MICO|nr:MurR/RpiR family transcriptional regulator [Candidatus Agrococcus pullicola]
MLDNTNAREDTDVDGQLNQAQGESSALLRLRAALPQLGPSEGRVVQAILENLTSIAETSTAELARLAKCSPATVIRACQNVGFRGYQHLRIELAKEPLEQSPTDRHVLEEVFREASEAIEVSQQLLSQEAFDRAVDALIDADRILISASGFSLPPTQDTVIRLIALGLTVLSPADVFTQQFAARQMGKGDVVLAVTYSGANTHTLRTAASAKHDGAKVIALTSFAQSPITKAADISLVTGPVGRSNDIDPHLSRVSHSLVLHSLYRGVLKKRRGAFNRFSEMGEVIADALSDDLDT